MVFLFVVPFLISLCAEARLKVLLELIFALLVVRTGAYFAGADIQHASTELLDCRERS